MNKMKDKGIVISEYPILDVMSLVRKQKMDLYGVRDILSSRLKIPFRFEEGKYAGSYPSVWSNSFVTPNVVIYGPEEAIFLLDNQSFPDPSRIRKELSDRIESNWADEWKNVAKNVEEYWFGQNHFSLSKEEFDGLHSRAKKDNAGTSAIVGYKDLEFQVRGALSYNFWHPVTLVIFGNPDDARRYNQIC